MEARDESDPMDVGSESADGEGDVQLQRTADRIMRILSQVAECLDEDEMEDMNAIVLEILELSKKNDTETKEMLIEYYIGFLELVEFCSGISVELIQQAIRSFLLIEQDAESLGKLVYDLYMEMILIEYPSLGIDMNLTPDLLRAYFRLLTEGYEEICHIRLMVVGMYGVGKTTLIRRLCNENVDNVVSTVGIDIFTKSCEINDDGDWEISREDEQERFYSERLQELVNKYGKRTHFQNTNSSFSESEPSTMTTSTITSSPSTQTLPEYETEAFKMKVKENRQEDDKSFYKDFEKAAKEKKTPKRKPTVSIWDFAGQSVYYSTHHFFLNARSTYLVVLDISKKLTEKVKENEKNPILESTTEGYTCLDAFKFWMRSIYIYTEQKKRQSDHGRIQIPQYKPKIILIGTHKDKLTDDDLQGKTYDKYAADYFREALKCFNHTPLMDLVHETTFLISKDDEAEVFLSIKKEILKIAKGSPVWREKVPANFILLEKAVHDKKKQGDYLMYFENLEKVNESSDLPRQEKNEIKTFLAFQNAFGNVIYYEQNYLDQMIVLKPQWIIDIFKIFITHKHIKQPEISEQSGKLEEGFIFQLLEENGWSKMKYPIVKCMEYLNVMVRPIASGENEGPVSISQERMTTRFFQNFGADKQTVENFYIMPCQLQPRPVDEKLKEVFTDCGGCRQPPTLCMYIKKGFLPPFVFHCIIATIMKELPIAMIKRKYLMFTGLAGFQLNNTTILLIWCKDNFLHFSVIFKDPDETDEERVKCCKDVRRDFENLVLRIFSFHRADTFNDDLFEYMVMCPKCPEQVPFQTGMEQNLYLNMEGFFSVKNLQFTKKMHCKLCDEIVKEKDTLQCWFDHQTYEPGSVSSVQEKYLKDKPTVDMLADFAEEIGSNYRRLANELLIKDTVYEQIEYSYGKFLKNLVFHVLYKWMLKDECLKMLFDAMKKSGCSTENFERIVRRIETEETEKKINDCMEKLDENKFNNNYQWGRVVNKVVESIGDDYWLIGIRLGTEVERMQRMAQEKDITIEGRITKYLEEWRKKDKGLKDLIKALVKSSSKVDEIINAVVEIYSS